MQIKPQCDAILTKLSNVLKSDPVNWRQVQPNTVVERKLIRLPERQLAICSKNPLTGKCVLREKLELHTKVYQQETSFHQNVTLS